MLHSTLHSRGSYQALNDCILLYESCEIIFVAFNYKIKFSFVDLMITNLFCSNRKGKIIKKEICSEMSCHVATSFNIPEVRRGVKNSVIPSAISASYNTH